MSQPALLVNGSPRPRGNTHWLSSLVVNELHQRGVATRVAMAVSLKSVNNGCIGCEGCQRSKEFVCVFKDDIQPLVAAMPTYRYVIFATPVYFFGPTAQTKLVLDRMFSLIKSKGDGSFRHPFDSHTKFGLIVTAGGEEGEGCDLVVETFRRLSNSMQRPLETLTMPSAPLSPEQIEDTTPYDGQVKEFCDRLMS